MSSVLKAITHCWLEDGIPMNKVVGIFYPNQLLEQINTIQKVMGGTVNYDTTCDNYDIVISEDVYFYTGNYIIGELYL